MAFPQIRGGNCHSQLTLRLLPHALALILSKAPPAKRLIAAYRDRRARGFARRMAHKTFSYGGTALRYCYFGHSFTYDNERCIEVAIGRHFLEHHHDVLEIGNVMNRYFHTPHQVVDLYERALGVRNEDVIDIRDPHESVLSISTLEHVGFDEDGDHTKFYLALENLKSICTGALLFTVPWGYNPSVDAFIRRFTGTMSLYYRDGREWRRGTLAEIELRGYGARYNYANAIAVVEMPGSRPVSAPAGDRGASAR